MEIYQVKKEGTKLVQWDRSKRHREIDRSYILVTEEHIQLIKNNEFLVSNYQGKYNCNEILTEKISGTKSIDQH